jgi:exopolyphosphatase/guanosine-5'-triphosphate,3'-diphosphate pyrophosphatase
MLKAVIDLGTNTFNLLVAEVNNEGLEIVYSCKEGVGLGMGGINQNIIAPDAFIRGIQALRRSWELALQLFGTLPILHNSLNRLSRGWE